MNLDPGDLAVLILVGMVLLYWIIRDQMRTKAKLKLEELKLERRKIERDMQVWENLDQDKKNDPFHQVRDNEKKKEL